MTKLDQGNDRENDHRHFENGAVKSKIIGGEQREYDVPEIEEDQELLWSEGTADAAEAAGVDSRGMGN